MIKQGYTYYIVIIKATKDIYAYTDDKNIFEKFKEIRSPNIFKYKKVKITKEDLRELFDIHPTGYLSINELPTKYIGTVPVSITAREKQELSSMGSKLFSQLGAVDYRDIQCLKSEFFRSLSVLGYYDVWAIMNRPDMDGNIYNDMTIDFLSLFIKLYGDTMRC